MSQDLKPCLVHSCHSADMNEPKPKKCSCKFRVSQKYAHQMVKNGEADWLIDYTKKIPNPTWDLVYRGRVAKTPRAHTLEKAHFERGLERQEYLADQEWLSDDGAQARNIEAAAMGETEQAELFELYHNLELEERYNLFHGCGKALRELKNFSDTFGVVTGTEGRYVAEIIEGHADTLKSANCLDDPFEGRTLFPMIGQDQRTNYGKKNA